MLIEQLLRCVPDLEAIYVLVRPKQGAEPEARIDRLLARPIFDSLRVPAGEGVEEGRESEEKQDETSSDVVGPSSSSSSLSPIDGGASSLSSNSNSDVDSANNATAGGRPDGDGSSPSENNTEEMIDGVLQFKAPRRPLLPHLRAKIRVLSGDVCKLRCGLSEADAKVVSRECDFIVHCAASISFFEHVHVLLEQHYAFYQPFLSARIFGT